MTLAHERLLTDYCRPIAHLRSRFRTQRLGLVFGDEVGRDLGFPGHWELLDRLAVGLPAAAAGDFSDDDPAGRARALFEHFCVEDYPAAEPDGRFTPEDAVRTRWLERLHYCLYGSELVEPAVFERRAPYLKHFLPLLRAIPVSVNYNLDDTLERLLHLDAVRGNGPLRRYLSLWGPAALPPPDGGAVYHPDGFLPSRLRDDIPRRDAFLDHAVLCHRTCDGNPSPAASLAAYFREMTCLVVGSSLRNSGLRDALSRSAEQHPGHVHYFVRRSEEVPPERRQAETRANFARYNLVTLFLTAEEVAALADLVHDDRLFESVAGLLSGRGCVVPLKFVYYLVGASGVGKTTTLRYFYDFRPHEEWLEPLFHLMTRDFTTLTEAERREVDDWVDAQWERKNATIAGTGPGIDIVDRGPLDALAYIPPEAMAGRAARVLAAIRRSGPPVTPGHVIRLRGSDALVRAQAQRAFRIHGLAGTEWQQKQIGAAYEIGNEDPSTVNIDGLTAAGVARRIARIIHLSNYCPKPLDDRLVALAAS